jgi:CBS domain-containing protein
VRPETRIYNQLVGDYMRAAPPTVPAGTPARDAIARMSEAAASALLVVDAGAALKGIVTERDVTRRIAFRLGPDAPIDQAMTAPVATIRADDYLFHGVARMRQAGLRHMPVVDGSGAPVGLLDLHEALAAATDEIVRQIDLLTQDDSLEGLRRIKAVQADIAGELLRDDIPATDILALITNINRDIHHRVVRTVLAGLRSEGRGEPPVPFTVIVMGSSGRGENLLYPDQDNGFILDDYPDDEHNRIDAFFIELAERMTRALDEVGFPLCKGYVMATNPLWRKTRSQWREQIGRWVNRGDGTAVLFSDIFFDFEQAYGEPGFAAELRAWTTEQTAKNIVFLRQIYQEQAEHGSALGFFGRLRTEQNRPEHKGEVNLKAAGTLPLVEMVRFLALREGLPKTSTVARLAGLAQIGVLDPDAHESLAAAFQTLTRLLLRQQVRDFKAGRAVGTYVDPEGLSRRDRKLLVEAMRAIEELRARVRMDFTGGVI